MATSTSRRSQACPVGTTEHIQSGVEPSRVVRLGPFQGIGDRAEQIHVHGERGRRRTFVLIEGQPYRSID
jgi:hypothetical protein